MDSISSGSRPLYRTKALSACPSLTMCLTAPAATLTSAPDATLTSLMRSNSSTISSSAALATLIYSTFILYYLISDTNFELFLHKNFLCKFYYPQLISFLENALSAQLNSYKSLDLVIFSALRFLGF